MHLRVPVAEKWCAHRRLQIVVVVALAKKVREENFSLPILMSTFTSLLPVGPAGFPIVATSSCGSTFALPSILVRFWCGAGREEVVCLGAYRLVRFGEPTNAPRLREQQLHGRQENRYGFLCSTVHESLHTQDNPK